MRSCLALAVALLVAAAVGACTRPPPPTSPSVDARFGAPPVMVPRDVRPFAEDPCRGPLAPSDWRLLGYAAAGRTETLPTGEQSCTWEAPDGSQDVTIIVVASRDVLVDTYRARQFPIFRPTVIEGLPATLEQSSAESIGCTITVGTAEGQGFIADYYEGNLGPEGRAEDPCARGQQAAARVASALPPLPDQ